MINVVISLIYTAYGILKSEVESRAKAGVDIQELTKALFTLEACAMMLEGKQGGLSATVHALNRAIDASQDEEYEVTKKNKNKGKDK